MDLQTTISALRPGDELLDAGSWLKVQRTQELGKEVVVFCERHRSLYFRPHRRCTVRRSSFELVPGESRIAGFDDVSLRTEIVDADDLP